MDEFEAAARLNGFVITGDNLDYEQRGIARLIMHDLNEKITENGLLQRGKVVDYFESCKRQLVKIAVFQLDDRISWDNLTKWQDFRAEMVLL